MSLKKLASVPCLKRLDFQHWSERVNGGHFMYRTGHLLPEPTRKSYGHDNLIGAPFPWPKLFAHIHQTPIPHAPQEMGSAKDYE